MEYNNDSSANYNLASQQNVDTGMGLERTIAVLDGFEDNYLASMWQPIIEKIEELSKKSYKGNEKEMRIIADHIKAATFIIADGITPSNADQGYVLRRLIRRAVRNLKKLDVPILDYDILKENSEKILKELKLEEDRFQATLDKGLKEFEKMSTDKKIDAQEAFLLFQSYGFPLEMTKELASEKGLEVEEKGIQ